MRALCAILLALVAAGCGGGGEDRLSREEFAQRATTICTEVRREVQALPQPATITELGGYARRARTATSGGVARLRELRPPRELEEPFARYLQRAERVVELLEELERAAAAGDEAEARRLVEELAASDARRLARDAGVPRCEPEE